MPKIPAKQIQKELTQGKLWPVYWLYGQEAMKSRELVKRIRSCVTKEDSSFINEFSSDVLDGAEVTSSHILDSAMSLSLGGGKRLILVQNAHFLKDLDILEPLLEADPDGLSTVCVFVSKDLDQRKKFSKKLVEKAAVIACAEIEEHERGAWIGYLAKRRKLELEQTMVAQLQLLDPWSLDIVDQELEKYELALSTFKDPVQSQEVLQGQGQGGKSSQKFLEAFFSRNLNQALREVKNISRDPNEAIPLLGLLAWNARHLIWTLGDQKAGTRTLKLHPFAADKIKRWSSRWKLSEAKKLQIALADLDFGTKQTPLEALGLWTHLSNRFCHHQEVSA